MGVLVECTFECRTSGAEWHAEYRVVVVVVMVLVLSSAAAAAPPPPPPPPAVAGDDRPTGRQLVGFDLLSMIWLVEQEGNICRTIGYVRFVSQPSRAMLSSGRWVGK
eukprot:GHVU01055941.1.p2 GENE.GHVU01055941.1~~GHVU01055941.1.p2  ORF type:complete len:107 (+),score=11.97 GHVU01055941.1:311-631(+)